MRALNLTAPAVKAARHMPELKGKNPIGRGVFTAVFEGTRPDTVLKLTVDSRAYGLLCDGVLCCDGPHFPKVTRKFGQVGDVNIRGEDFPLYLYEVERLERLKGGTLASKQAHALIKLAYSASAQTPGEASDDDYSAQTLDHLVSFADEHPLLTGTLTAAVDMLRSWVHSNDEVSMDMHRANFMMTGAGTLVINDPICHRYLLNRIQRSWLFS
jgi:hypothetical protein